MPNAVVMTGYGPPEVLTRAQVPLPEPTPGRAPGALDETMALLAEGRLRLRTHTSMPMQQAAEAHRQLESGTVHQRIILTLP
jgi:NADPH:quinone reductase-like Zn-dependent oxidoreductase